MAGVFHEPDAAGAPGSFDRVLALAVTVQVNGVRTSASVFMRFAGLAYPRPLPSSEDHERLPALPGRRIMLFVKRDLEARAVV
jgi:hypothetical protein